MGFSPHSGTTRIITKHKNLVTGWLRINLFGNFLYISTLQQQEVLEINDGFSYVKIAFHCPRQVKEFGCDELENLVHIDVVCST